MIALRIVRAEIGRVRAEASGLGLAAAALLAAILLIALVSPLFPYQPGADVVAGQASLGPSSRHWLGTDHLGRDLFWRLLIATRAFVVPGALAALVAVGVGVPIGAASGWWGGTPAAGLRWVTASLASLPRFVWVLLVCASWGDSSISWGVAVGLAYCPAIAEAVHARIERLRATEYLVAARAHGVGPWRLLWLHGVLAGSGRLIARHAVLCFGYFLVIETTLAYIGGFGVSEPWPSLGNMLAFEWGWSTGAFAPALALWVAVAAVVAVADLLREATRG